MINAEAMVFKELTCTSCGKGMLVVCDVMARFDGRCGSCYAKEEGREALEKLLLEGTLV